MVPAPLLRRALISQEITPALVSFDSLSGIIWHNPSVATASQHWAEFHKPVGRLSRQKAYRRVDRFRYSVCPI